MQLPLDVGFAKDTLALTDYPGIALNESGSGFHPTLELLRFITPFGVGHFSASERLDEYKPVYIPKWEDSVHWEADISHLWKHRFCNARGVHRHMDKRGVHVGC